MNTIKTLATAGLVISLAACSTTDPYTGEQKTSNASKDAAIGAVAGAVLGAIVDHKNRDSGAIKGAILGAAVGGGIGQYTDEQEALLRRKLQGSGVSVSRTGNTIKLIMPSNVTFDVDQYHIRGEFYSTLDSVAEVLKGYDKTRINVYGHTDATGGAEYNQVLSERRAQSVGQLLSSHGVGTQRITTYGYGEQYPIASNDTEEGRQLNRRVELELIPPPETATNSSSRR